MPKQFKFACQLFLILSLPLMGSSIGFAQGGVQDGLLPSLPSDHKSVTRVGSVVDRLGTSGLASVFEEQRSGVINSESPGDKPTRVFIFAGQSNMVGADAHSERIDEYPSFQGLSKPQPDVLFTYVLERAQKSSEGWEPLQPVGSFGPELSFADKLKQQVDFPIAIIKSAVGGTTLAKDWNPAAPEDGLKLYPLTLNLVRNSLRQLEEKGIEYQLEAVVWHQGENDMLNREFNPQYGRRLKEFVRRLRKDLESPQLLFRLGEASEKGIWGMDHRQQLYSVTTQQRDALSQIKNAKFVPTSHLAFEVMQKGQPHYHFGTQGQLQLGEAFAEAYLTQVGRRDIQAQKRPTAKFTSPKSRPLNLFVFAGQRNMEGEDAFVSEISKIDEFKSTETADPSVPYAYSIGGGVRRSSGWEALGPIGFLDNFGPELSFARHVKQPLKGSLAILKFTDSGAQIPDWMPQGSPEQQRNLYRSFVQSIVSAKQDLEKKGYRVKVTVFWHPGENDTYFRYHVRYAENLSDLIAAVRRDTGLPTLPWYISEQHPKSIWKNMDALNQGLQKLAGADRNITFVTTSTLPHGRLHFETEGTLKLGVKYAEAWLRDNDPRNR